MTRTFPILVSEPKLWTVDFAANNLIITNATVIMTNGVVIAGFGASALIIRDYATLVSAGSPLARNRICHYATVQELATNWGGGSVSDHVLLFSAAVSANAGAASLRFTSLSVMGGKAFSQSLDNWTFASLGMRDCEVIGSSYFAGRVDDTIGLTNNLFWSVETWFDNHPTLYAYNNLFRNGLVAFIKADNTNTWIVRDSVFDSLELYDVGYPSTHDHNAYVAVTGDGILAGTTSSNQFPSAFFYDTGPLSIWYQPYSAGLTNKGSRLASEATLFHMTVSTNQIKETNSVVDIGYHLVALDGSGLPYDSDLPSPDGLPDYIEDADNDGSVDSGEPDWTDSDSDNDGVNDFLEVIQGRNPLAANTVSDTNGIINLKVYTPLK